MGATGVGGSGSSLGPSTAFSSVRDSLAEEHIIELAEKDDPRSCVFCSDLNMLSPTADFGLAEQGKRRCHEHDDTARGSDGVPEVEQVDSQGAVKEGPFPRTDISQRKKSCSSVEDPLNAGLSGAGPSKKVVLGKGIPVSSTDGKQKNLKSADDAIRTVDLLRKSVALAETLNDNEKELGHTDAIYACRVLQWIESRCSDFPKDAGPDFQKCVDDVRAHLHVAAGRVLCLP